MQELVNFMAPKSVVGDVGAGEDEEDGDHLDVSRLLIGSLFRSVGN